LPALRGACGRQKFGDDLPLESGSEHASKFNNYDFQQLNRPLNYTD
jgi:hypothetical protein